MKLCRGKTTRVKAHVEPNLGAVVKDMKKYSYKHISKKRKTKENLQPLLEVGKHIVTKNEETAEVFKAFFVSVFNGKTSCSLSTKPLELG